MQNIFGRAKIYKHDTQCVRTEANTSFRSFTIAL